MSPRTRVIATSESSARALSDLCLGIVLGGAALSFALVSDLVSADIELIVLGGITGGLLFSFWARRAGETGEAEKALRDSQLQYQELFQSSTDMVFTLDLKGNMTSLNEAGRRFTGYPIRRNLLEFVVPKCREQVVHLSAENTAGDHVSATL